MNEIVDESRRSWTHWTKVNRRLSRLQISSQQVSGRSLCSLFHSYLDNTSVILLRYPADTRAGIRTNGQDFCDHVSQSRLPVKQTRRAACEQVEEVLLFPIENWVSLKKLDFICKGFRTWLIWSPSLKMICCFQLGAQSQRDLACKEVDVSNEFKCHRPPEQRTVTNSIEKQEKLLFRQVLGCRRPGKSVTV